MKFIDQAVISLSSGHGGSGCMSFRRESGIPRGGPDGGDGGSGGNVYIEVDPRIHTLLDFRYKKKYEADQGHAGGGQNQTGANGKDVVIKVPAGTVLFNAETGQMVVDMLEGSKTIKILAGGKGGKGNTFYKSSINQAPRQFQTGLPGEQISLRLELKLVAHIGLVGFPNAGKSTLISAISEARPKVAGYPFTTLEPNLGVVRGTSGRTFVVADMPGLIEGAHKGQGLGHIFLKHVERTKGLVCVCDASDWAEQKPEDCYEKILNELELYDYDKYFGPPLSERVKLVILNKEDIVTDKNELLEAKSYFSKKGVKVMSLSGATSQGVKAFKEEIEKIVFDTKEN